MMDITAEPVLALYAVRLTATGYTGTVDWYEDQGAENRFVGTGPTVLDRAPRLNRPLNYFATDDVTTVPADQVTVAADRPVLGSTTTQDTLAVTVLLYRPYEFQGVSVWHPVLNRSDPFVTIHPALYPRCEIHLHAPTQADRKAIQALLMRGDPLLLRSACDDRLDTMTILPTDWSDPLMSDSRRSGPTRYEIRAQLVAEAEGLVDAVPGRTYADLPTEAATYADLKAMWPTYTALRDGAA